MAFYWKLFIEIVTFVVSHFLPSHFFFLFSLVYFDVQYLNVHNFISLMNELDNETVPLVSQCLQKIQKCLKSSYRDNTALS